MDLDLLRLFDRDCEMEMASITNVVFSTASHMLVVPKPQRPVFRGSITVFISVRSDAQGDVVSTNSHPPPRGLDGDVS